MATRTYRLLIVPQGLQHFAVTLYGDDWRGRDRRSTRLWQDLGVRAERLTESLAECRRLILEQSARRHLDGQTGPRDQEDRGRSAAHSIHTDVRSKAGRSDAETKLSEPESV